eukprot:6172698-Pleurochrysis_carterae.AAC.3
MQTCVAASTSSRQQQISSRTHQIPSRMHQIFISHARPATHGPRIGCVSMTSACMMLVTENKKQKGGVVL